MMLYLSPCYKHIHKILATVNSAKMISCNKDFTEPPLFLCLSSKLILNEYYSRRCLNEYYSRLISTLAMLRKNVLEKLTTSCTFSEIVSLLCHHIFFNRFFFIPYILIFTKKAPVLYTDVLYYVLLRNVLK